MDNTTKLNIIDIGYITESSVVNVVVMYESNNHLTYRTMSINDFCNLTEFTEDEMPKMVFEEVVTKSLFSGENTSYELIKILMPRNYMKNKLSTK